MENRIHILRFRAQDKGIFLDVKSSKKSVETRAATVKNRRIETGDRIKFVCGKENFIKTVKTSGVFKGVENLLKKYKVREINPALQTKEELQEMYDSFPSYKEKIKKNGIIAWELES